MKKIIIAISLSCAAFTLPGLVSAQAATAQTSKMATCNADAKTKALKGEDRKKFMKECLSAKAAEPSKMAEEKKAMPAAAAHEGKKLTVQQEKMVACNKDAKTKALKGDDRKKFMKECLSAKK
ncbi:MAG: PsiF family protein [Thiomonas sp.]|uniref:Putative Phosphate starvation-inducible protein psiF n=1 Tax=mine drainage metagenome TaxID=410659 RepID=E6PVK1_9ZZZZ